MSTEGVLTRRKCFIFPGFIHLCSSPLSAASFFCLQLEDSEAHLLGGPERKLRNGSAQGQRFQVHYSSVQTVKKRKKRSVRPHRHACTENKTGLNKSQRAALTRCSPTLFHLCSSLKHFRFRPSSSLPREPQMRREPDTIVPLS